MRVAFVCQKHYFDCCLPSFINGHEIHSFDYSWGQDYQHILNRKNDFDLWFFIRGEHTPEVLLKQLSGKKVWVSSEPIEREDVISSINVGFSKGFDKCYHYDKTHIEKVRQLLGKTFDGEFQLPVNIAKYHPVNVIDKKYDFCFCGRSTIRREEYMGLLKHLYKFLHVAHGLIGAEYVKTIQKAKINLNLHIDNYPQLQHRMQNMLACGCFVMSEPLTHDDDLKDGIHYVSFDSKDDLLKKSQTYLLDNKERDKIAKQGYEYVKQRFDSNKCWKKLIEECI